MIWRRVVLLFLILCPVIARAQNVPVYGFCVNGALPAITSGLPSSNFNQNLIPLCTVTVYLTGTTTPATIYADKTGTTLTNPFTANKDASWTFYVASSASQTYDVVLSGGVAPNAYVTPRTLVSIGPSGGGGGGGSAPAPPSFSVQASNSGSTALISLPGLTVNPSLGTFNSPNTVSKLPVVDVRSPDFGTATYGCSNAADPLGVLDSTCAIRAAVTYAEVALQGTGSLPCIYLPGGLYKISGAIRIPPNICVKGDGIAQSIVEQTNTASDWFDILSGSGGLSGPISASFTSVSNMKDLQFYCAVTGTIGQSYSAYSGCKGSMLKLDNVTNYFIDNIQFNNNGGRCLDIGGGSEQVNVTNIVFTGCRWPQAGSGQANSKFQNFIVNGGGQDGAGYCWGANCPQGVFQEFWNPSAVTITNITLDGTGHGSATVTCTPATSCYAGVNGTSAPISAGHAFTIAGVTDSGVVAANGTWLATSVSGTPCTGGGCGSGNAFTVNWTMNTGGTWNYGPDFGLIYFCGNNTTCAVSTPSGTSSSPGTSATFLVSKVPTGNACIYGQGANNDWDNMRVDPLWYCQGQQITSPQQSIVSNTYDEVFTLHNESALNGALRIGGANPYTTLTNALAGSATAPVAVPVYSTLWFQNYATDVTYAVSGVAISSAGSGQTPGTYIAYASSGNAAIAYTISSGGALTKAWVAYSGNGYTSTPPTFTIAAGGTPGAVTASVSQVDLNSNRNNMVLMPCDYNPNQTGVPSACVSGVNTNQYELVSAAFGGDGNLWIFTRNVGGSTAPAGTTWPVRTLVGWNRAVNVQTGVNSIQYLQMIHSSDSLAGSSLWAPIFGTFPLVTGTTVVGPEFDNITIWPPGGSNTGSYNQKFNVSVGSTAYGGSNPTTGEGCLVNTTSNVITDTGVDLGAAAQLPPMPSVTSGSQTGFMSNCIIGTNYTVGATTYQPAATTSDLLGHSTMSAPSNNALNAGWFDGKLNGYPSSSNLGPAPGYNIAHGGVFSTWDGFQDIGGYVNTQTATSWSWSGSSLTFNGTFSPQFVNGEHVTISGLTTGAKFNTPTGQWCAIISSSGSTFVCNPLQPPVLNVADPTSATENATIADPHSKIQFGAQGGPFFNSETNACAEARFWNDSASLPQFVTGWSVCGVAGSGGATMLTPSTTSTTLGGPLTVNGASSLNGGFSASGLVAIGNLSNLIPNSQNFAAGTWATPLGSATPTTGQADPWGGTTATKFVVTSAPWDFNDILTSSITSGTPYNVCGWFKGGSGGEVLSLGVDLAASSITLTTSWQYLCVAVTAASNSNIVWSVQTALTPTIYIAGASTTLSANATGFIVTGASPQPTPTAEIAYPFLPATLSANSGTTVPLTDLCTGTPSAGKYCDGAGAWTSLSGAGSYAVYNTSGTALTGAHGVFATGALTGGTLAVTLSGSAVYTSSSSYMCSVQDTTTPANAVTITYTSGTAFTLTGTGTDAVKYRCVGN